MNKVAIYPGTFDPITYGHIDVIKKGLKLFDKIVVGVSDVSSKNYLFSSDERINIVNKALENCLISDLNITGLNMEVAPGQSELQIRDVGINAADGLIVLRYILSRTAEEYGYDIDYSAKPVKGDWNGSGCHVNFSTLPMREDEGYQYIMKAILKLEKNL